MGAAAAEQASTSGAKASKGAVKLVTPRGKALRGPWQRYADRALVPTVHGRVRVRVQRCPARPASAGCVYTKRPRTIFVRPGLRDPRGVLLHELGHVYDLTVMNNRDRGAFRRIMRRSRAKWWRGTEPLAEQFAEAYSWCARYARIVSIARYSSYDYRPTARQHKRICKLVRSAAGDRRAAAKPPALPVVTRPATVGTSARSAQPCQRPFSGPPRGVTSFTAPFDARAEDSRPEAASAPASATGTIPAITARSTRQRATNRSDTPRVAPRAPTTIPGQAGG
jgi:hypothetical protein